MLAEISCSRVFELLFRFRQLLIRLIVIKIKSVTEKKIRKFVLVLLLVLVLVLVLILVLVLVLVLVPVLVCWT